MSLLDKRIIYVGKLLHYRHCRKLQRLTWFIYSRMREFSFLSFLLFQEKIMPIDRNLCAVHGKRVTIQPKDIHLARRLRGNEHL